MVGWSGILTIASCKPYMSGYDFIPYLTFINRGFVAQLAAAPKINKAIKINVLNAVLWYPSF